MAAHGQGCHCGAEPCWGREGEDLNPRGRSEGLQAEEGHLAARGHGFLPVCLSELLAHILSRTCLPTPPVVLHTGCPNFSRMVQLSLPALTPPLVPSSAPVPDFPVLLVERLVQELVQEQDTAPPGDSRSHWWAGVQAALCLLST